MGKKLNFPIEDGKSYVYTSFNIDIDVTEEELNSKKFQLFIYYNDMEKIKGIAQN
jgi:hypothetical protein